MTSTTAFKIRATGGTGATGATGAAALVLFAALGVAASAAWSAPDVQVEVSHASSALGADGIQRSTAFSERMVRRANTVWIERVLPASVQAEHAHDHALSPPAKGHKHVNLSAATRWIEKQANGRIKLKLVAASDKVVVDVAPAEYNNVGFDGSWLAAYHLMDPVGLKAMKQGEREGAGRWYEAKSKADASTVRVLWDEKLELPLKVLSRNAAGTTTRSTTVRVLGAVTPNPWTNTVQYAVKEYSDFLD
jgi:hypothetical protein